MLGGFNEQLFEGLDMISAFNPVDLNTGSNAGIYISLRDYHRCAFGLVHTIGTASDTYLITLLQAKDSAGVTNKALNFTQIRYKHTMTTAANDTWTTVKQAAANTYTTPTAGGVLASLTIIDLESQALDDAGGYHWVNMTVGVPGHTAVGWGFYLPYNSRHSQFVPVSTLDS